MTAGFRFYLLTDTHLYDEVVKLGWLVVLSVVVLLAMFLSVRAFSNQGGSPMSEAKMIAVQPVHAPAPGTLQEVLERLDAWYVRYLPSVHRTLRPGATDAELNEFERRSGIRLPADFRALYRWHDGQNWSVGGVLGLDFQPLSHVEYNWQLWKDSAENSDETSLNSEMYIVSQPTGAIRELYATPKVVPFLSDGGGNFVALDFNPDVAGISGQVITTGRDEVRRYVLAPNVEAFLREYLHRLESVQVVVRQLPGYESEMWSARLTDAQGHGEEGYYRLGDLYPGFGASPAVIQERTFDDDSPMSLETSLSRLEVWLSRNHPDLFAQLGGPASAGELKDAAARLGGTLPDDLETLYRKHRDWKEVFGLHSIPVDQLGQQDPSTFGSPDGPGTRVPYSSYDIQTSAQDWLPFLRDDEGNYVGVNQRKYGEVLTFGPGIKPRVVLKEQLVLLMDRYVRFAEAGLLKREGNRLVLPDAEGKYGPVTVKTAFPGFGASPAIR